MKEIPMHISKQKTAMNYNVTKEVKQVATAVGDGAYVASIILR